MSDSWVKAPVAQRGLLSDVQNREADGANCSIPRDLFIVGRVRVWVDWKFCCCARQNHGSARR